MQKRLFFFIVFFFGVFGVMGNIAHATVGSSCTASISGVMKSGTCKSTCTFGTEDAGIDMIACPPSDGESCCVPNGTTGTGGTGGGTGVIGTGVVIPSGIGLSNAPMIQILVVFMDWLLSIGAIIAIIAFIVSGIQYLVSAGNDSIIETAKRNMTYSIVGVIVMLSGLIIITAIDEWFWGTSVAF